MKAYDSFTRVAWVESVTDHRIFTVSDELSGSGHVGLIWTESLLLDRQRATE